MSDGTKIEWTDATLNVVSGCTVISPGCTNCYAMRAGARGLPRHPSNGLTQPSKAGHVWTGEVRFNEVALLLPLSWRRPRRIFWNAHGDLFHENVPDEWIDKVFAVFALTPQHSHQILTKRSARMREYCAARSTQARVLNAMDALLTRGSSAWLGWPLPNVWAGVSVEDQARRERVLDLAQTPAAIRFTSGEPLLEGITLTDIPLNGGADEHGIEWLFNALTGEQYFIGDDGFNYGGDGPPMSPLDWVIVGGESGSGARPMHPDWAIALRDDCKRAGVPFLFKQWGDWAPVSDIAEDVIDACYAPAPARDPEGRRRCKVSQCVLHRDGSRFDGRSMYEFGAFHSGASAMTMMEIGKRKAGRLLRGDQHDAMPA